MSTLTRRDLADKIVDEFGLTARDAYRVVDLFFAEIGDSLARGESVLVSGLGSFRILNKSARIGRNPKTGVAALIPARRVPSFKAGNEFRDKLKK
ncbi:MAG: integration host factor subunit alpha [Rickettsiales bacterium]|jgi:integration host factor subunit alpha|nr:integration host factor subunit alpha [Rickettsiales bacterium]